MPTVTMEWESRLGRRLRIRDLYILSTVVKSGSMVKAARQLAMSQPAVSEAIANLEHVLRVRLLDRSPKGIEPTIYANAMLRRSTTVFDELKQGVRDIEFLADPSSGELKVGYTDTLTATVLVPQIVERFSERYPRVITHTDLVSSPALKFSSLINRTYDLVLARSTTPTTDDVPVDDVNVERLFDDPLVIVVGTSSRWAHRRKIDLAELNDEPWILSAPGGWSYERVAEAFKIRGLRVPTANLVTHSIDLRAKLLTNGRFITAIPRSVVRLDANRTHFKMLPVDLPVRPWLVTMLTLKNRTLSPLVERFMECARGVAKPLAKAQAPRSQAKNISARTSQTR
jgi:DNA-binding transcriptional LysR family regulator